MFWIYRTNYIKLLINHFVDEQTSPTFVRGAIRSLTRTNIIYNLSIG